MFVCVNFTSSSIFDIAFKAYKIKLYISLKAVLSHQIL